MVDPTKSSTVAPLLLALLAVAIAASAQTTVPDLLVVSDYTREDMQALIEREAFGEDPDTGYPGLPNQGIARRLDRAMDASLLMLLSVAEETRSRKAVLERVRGLLNNARTLQLGEAENERILWFYGEACAILGVEVEEETLATWLHGPSR